MIQGSVMAAAALLILVMISVHKAAPVVPVVCCSTCLISQHDAFGHGGGNMESPLLLPSPELACARRNNQERCHGFLASA